ncbi:pyrroline-5-carboxylate reductase [Bacillaceae bacterium S4-13-58]
MDKKIGFIGCGKMGQAILSGIMSSGITSQQQVIVSTRSTTTMKKVQELYQVNTTLSNMDVVSFADIVFLAVKPDEYASILKEIKPSLKKNSILISIAAGVTLKDMEQAVGQTVKLVRTMPNTPAFVQEGMTVFCSNDKVSDHELETVSEILQSFGRTEVISEVLMDSIPAISGSSPAYVYMFIEALADGGVLQGIPREQAYRLAAQAVLGAAKMVLDSGEHPGVLKDQVCTPGGATIEAVAELEKNHFRSSVIQAMERCTRKTKGIGS